MHQLYAKDPLKITFAILSEREREREREREKRRNANYGQRRERKPYKDLDEPEGGAAQGSKASGSRALVNFLDI